MIEPSGKIKEIYENIEAGKSVSVFGARRYARWTVFAYSECGVLVESDYIRAHEAYQFLKSLTDVCFMPDTPDSMCFWEERKSEKDYERAEALALIATGKIKHVVTYVEAAMRLYPLKEDISSCVTFIRLKDKLDPQSAAETLIKAGYRRREQVASPGEFSIRGDLMDVYSATGEEECYRFEFEFDEVSSIRKVDLDAQTALEAIEEVMFPPLGESFYSEKEGSAVLSRILTESEKLSGEGHSRFDAFYADIERAVTFNKRDIPFLTPYLSRKCRFSEYMAGYPVYYGDSKLCSDQMEMLEREHNSRSRSLIETGDALVSCRKLVVNSEKTFPSSGKLLCFHTGDSQNRIFSPDIVVNLNEQQAIDYYYDFSMLERDICQWTNAGVRTELYVGNTDNQTELENKLKNSKYNKENFEIIPKKLTGSVIFPEYGFVMLGTAQLFYKKQGDSGKKHKDIVVLPEAGDYVVHHIHGIGRCKSIEKLNFSGVEHDYVIVEYDGGDMLYIPVENLDSLSKYSFTGAAPKLAKIGSGAFERAKQKVKKSIQDIAVNLAELYGKRNVAKGYVYAQEPALMQEFISAFPYVDTEDQATATEDGLRDLSEGRVMDRLLCGDVGFGKTEVALRLAYRVISEGHQVAFLCPTTILALQHYKTALKRMGQFGVRIAMLSRMVKPKELAETLKKIEYGEIDLVIGTHKLLSKKLVFKQLGLLVLDEEQRFGVVQKDKLKKLRDNVNVFAMSATPIPRTLHMSLSGIRDISTLTTPPFTRLPVQTFVCEYSDGLLIDAITREQSRGGQSFIVFNRVIGIDAFAEKVKKLLPRLKVDVVHGQMAPEKAEEGIEKFASGETDVLVATTIIENGIDIPKANCMIVINADTFGLSQMYQLRGRIGRGNRLASVYFTYESSKDISSVSMERLDAIMQCKDLGSGFMLAMRDLEIRGAGNILGREQHGHMEEIGYETYMKLLKEVMSEMQGVKITEPKDTKVSSDYPAFIPEDYVPDREWRMRQYKAIASISSQTELKRTQKRLSEVYGPLPDAVKNLLVIAMIRNIAAKLQADRVEFKKQTGKLIFNKATDVPQDLVSRAEMLGGRLSLGNELWIEFANGPTLAKFLCNYVD